MVHNKIIKGECLSTLKEMPDNCVDHTLTSPPYNNKTNKIVNKGNSFYTDYKDNKTDEGYYDFIREVIYELLRVSNKYVFFNVMYNVDNKHLLCKLMGEFALNMKDILIWEKPIQPAMCTYVLTHNYEFIWVLSKKQENRKYDIDFGKQGNHRTCFKELGNSIINRERFSCDGNFAVMSIQVARRIINTFTKPEELILDPFMGSGTTAAACKQLGRNYLGIEMLDSMIKIANDRIDSVTAPLF